MAKSFLTPSGSTVVDTAGNVVPFDSNEWQPTEVKGEVMQALQKASVIERVGRSVDMATNAEFHPRDHGTDIDSPRLVGFFPDLTGGDEVLLRPSIFGTQIAFERWDLDDSKPNPIPPKVQAWIREAARAMDRVSFSTNPNATTAEAVSGGTWEHITTGSDSTVVAPETHVPAASLFATLAMGRSEDKILSPYANGDTIAAGAGGNEGVQTPTTWKRGSGESAVADEYQFEPGLSWGATRDYANTRPVHCVTETQMRSNGYDLFSATKAYLEDGYFFREGGMVWIVPYGFRDILRRIKTTDGIPLLATAPGGEFDVIFGDPVLYSPGMKLSRKASTTETPKANVKYAAASTPGTDVPTPASNAATHAFNPNKNGGYKAPTIWPTGNASATNAAPGKTVGLFIAYGDPMHLIWGRRGGPEYMASRYDAESKFNKDFLKMQVRRGFSIGFPNAWAGLCVVPGTAWTGTGKGVTAGDPVNPITGRPFTQTTV